MLIPTDDPAKFRGGPADCLCILLLPAGTYHAAFFEECPMPGPVQPLAELSFIRLKSKMHHTAGAPSLPEAQAHLDELRQQILLPDANVLREVAVPVAEPVRAWAVSNWTTGACSLAMALGVQSSAGEGGRA